MSVGQQRLRQLDEIFSSALELKVIDRSAYLDRACSEDRQLRLEAERLLGHHDTAATFLEEPAIAIAIEARATGIALTPMEGELIAHYKVGPKLGSGGMGVVYQGEDLKLRRQVALKFLYEDWLLDIRSISKLEDEARAASSLNHPNICTVYAIEEHRGQPVLVMELLEGQSLYQRMRAEPIGTDELIRLAIQTCDALAAAHKNGIVHRDIKPANLFLMRDGRLKLLDFGIAAWHGGDDRSVRQGPIAGTLLYMSPEQLRGDDIDGRSDLFSLGAVLYELATGVRVFERSSPALTAQAVLHGDVADPSTLNRAMPAALDRVIVRLLEKDRERRYSTAAEVSRDLQALPRLRTRTGRWPIAMTGVLALVAASAVFLLQNRQGPVLTNKDTIVLADFANTTGDRVFNETLRQGLAVQLQQSPFLSLVSDDRIQQILRLMAKPSGTPITSDIAREVCQRAESAAVLDGAISNLGRHYVLLLRARNCSTGDLLFSEQAEAAGKEHVLQAITKMAGSFRRRAGESLTTLEKHATPLSEATTPSLEAWNAFSEGWRVGMRQGHAVAIPFLKHAIEIDPNFASAHALLGRNYSAIGEMELAREHTRKAFEQRQRANDQERFFIDFSYDRLVTGNLEKAAETCELWSHMYPRDVRAPGLYVSTARALGKLSLATEEAKRAVVVDPDHPYAYAHLMYLSLYQADFAGAREWLQKATERKFGIPDFLMLRHLMAFLQADSTELDRVDKEAEHWSEIQDWVWGERAAVLAFSGRLEQARLMSRRAVEVALEAKRGESAAQHEAAAAVREALFGDKEAARTRATAAQRLSRGKDAEYGAALAYAFTGDEARAETIARHLQQRYPEDTLVRHNFLPTLRAISFIQRGNARHAIELLEPAERYDISFLGCCSVGFVGSLYPAYARGEAYLALHQGSAAAAQYQKILAYPGLAGSSPIALLAHWKLGKALAIAGNLQAARGEYEAFLSLWRDADKAVPILRQVKAEYNRLLAQED